MKLSAVSNKNKKARDRKDIPIGTLCLLKDLSTPKAGEEAKKVRPLYRKDPFVVLLFFVVHCVMYGICITTAYAMQYWSSDWQGPL